MANGLPRSLRRLLLRFEVCIEESVEAFASDLPHGARVLDAGAGECQHSQFFAHCRYAASDLGVGDVSWDYSRLDVSSDLSQLAFRDATFDAVLNVVVLEHVREPARVLAELARVLRPGGRLLLIVPQEWAVHQIPHDYYRYTRYGVRWLVEQAGLVTTSVEPVGGFFTVLGRRCLEAALFFQGGWRWLLLLPVAAVAGPLGVILPVLDRLDRERLNTLGYVCLAQKPA